MRMGKISERTAILIKMIPQLSRMYLENKHKYSNKLLSDDIIGDLLTHKFVGRTNETVILLLMDGKRKQLFCGVVSEGSLSGAEIYITLFLEKIPMRLPID